MSDPVKPIPKLEWRDEGDKHGMPGYISVYRNDQPIHHWPTLKQAMMHIGALQCGLDDAQAVKAVEQIDAIGEQLTVLEGGTIMVRA